MKSNEKQKNPSFFNEFGKFMKPYATKYYISIFISILSVGANLGSYAFAGLIAKELFTNQNQNIIFKYCILVIVFKLVSGILLNLSTWISHRAAYHTLKDIRLTICDKMLKLPMGYFEKSGSGRLKTMIVDHIENMEKTLAHMLPELTANIVAPLCLIVWMLIIDWRLTLASIIWMFVGLSISGGMMKGYQQKYQGQIQALKSMNQAVVEFVNGIEVIKNFGRVDECYKKYQDCVYNHARYNVTWQKETQKYTALAMAIAPFTIFPIIIFGLFLNLDAGKLFSMILLSIGIFGPIMNASSYFDQLAGMTTNLQEINEVLEYPELKRGNIQKVDYFDIEYEKVDFSYDEKKKVLDSISFHLKEGQSLALVGPSGSGKSTIAKLLAGYWDLDAGQIKIGNISIQDMTQEYLNKMIAYVDQDTFLFDDTIENNIKLSCPHATQKEVMEYAIQAGCDNFIKSLPDGYDTVVGVSGSKLSGGEKQRIAIVRAMMKNAPIVILDEATASTDPENEASIQDSLSAMAKDKTLIIVAHRLSTIVNCNQIAYVKDGRIQQMGTHAQLLSSCNEYKQMWDLNGGECNA